MTLPIILTIAGCVALLVGLFGGGVKAKEIEVPKISLLPRIISSLIGLMLIGAAIWMSPNVVSPMQTPPTAVPPTQIVPTSVPPTSIPTMEVSPTKVPATEVPPPTTNPSLAMTTTAFSVQATQMEATSQAIAARQREIGLTQTAVWLQSQSFAGQWYWNGSLGPVISVNGDSLWIDMSAYGRPGATGRILDKFTIEVTFPDDATYIGTLVRENRIEWPNGTIWEK